MKEPVNPGAVQNFLSIKKESAYSCKTAWHAIENPARPHDLICVSKQKAQSVSQYGSS